MTLKRHPVQRLMGAWLFESWTKTVKNTDSSSRNMRTRDGLLYSNKNNNYYNVTSLAEAKTSPKIRVKIIITPKTSAKLTRKDFGPRRESRFQFLQETHAR